MNCSSCGASDEADAVFCEDGETSLGCECPGFSKFVGRESESAAVWAATKRAIVENAPVVALLAEAGNKYT
jgi:ketosteroid isomerase-like protein